MHLPFLLLVNLLSETDRERGKFLELMGTNGGESFPEITFFMSLGREELTPYLNPGCLQNQVRAF